MNDSAPAERLSQPFIPGPHRSRIERAGTRGLRAAAGCFFLLFLPGAWLYFNAWAAWMNPSGYAPAGPPAPPVATASHLIAAVLLYCAARGIEALHRAAERAPT